MEAKSGAAIAMLHHAVERYYRGAGVMVEGFQQAVFVVSINFEIPEFLDC